MITRVVALSRAQMEDNKEKLLDHDNAIIISVIDPGSDPIFEEDDFDVMTLFFHDIEVSTLLKLQSKNQYTAFNQDQAERIIMFLHEHHSLLEKKTLFVNCSAGICRSGAIVTFAHLIFETDDIQFVQDNPRILPNQWVLSKLAEVHLGV